MMHTRSARWLYQATTAIGLALAAAGCASNDSSNSKLAAKEADHASMLVRYCKKMQAAGDLYVAASICQRAYDTNPNDPTPLYILADINLTLGATDQAANAYRAAIVINPNDFEALYGLAKTSIDLGNYDMAEAQLERALQLNNQDPRVYNALGIVKDQKEQHDVAQGLYRTGLLLDPNNVSLRNNLGLSLALAGRQGESVDMLRDVAGQPGTGTISAQNLALAANTHIAPPVSEDGDGPIEIRMESDTELALDDPMMEGDEMTAALAKPLHKTAGRPAEALNDGDADSMMDAMDGEPSGTPMSLISDGMAGDQGDMASEGQDGDFLGSATESLDPQMANSGGMGELSTSMPAEFLSDGDFTAPDEAPQTAAADAASSAEPAVMSPGGKYMIQVGAYGSQAGAEKGWGVVTKTAEDLLGNLEHSVEEAEGGKGTIYRLRAGPLADRGSSDRLCAALSDRGLGCFVVSGASGGKAAKPKTDDGAHEPAALPLKPAAEAIEPPSGESKSIQG